MRSSLLLTSFLPLLCLPFTSATTCSENDITALNYALTLEHLESAFYNNFQSQYTANDFTNAGYDQYAYPNFALIQAHEQAHVTALTQIITSRGGTAVPACNYNFTSINSVHAYVAVAQILENTGVTAYDGAINTFTDPSLAQAGATIATIEARHAAYLNQLNSVSPFPSDFDTATAPTAVVAEVLKTGLITSCPYPLAGPVVLRPTATTGASAASDPANAKPLTATETANDLVALNYALTLEHLESEFYNQFQKQYTANDFMNAGFNQTVYDELNMIAAHEQAHVSALTTTIQSLGGTAVPVCVYNFTSVNSVHTYIAVAKVLENTGVSAYDGAVNTISSTGLKQVAATIATVEARHAAVLNALNNVSPFPTDLDTAIAPNDIIAAVLATGFVTSCPYTLAGPVLLSTAGDCNNDTSSDASTGSNSGATTPSGATSAPPATGSSTSPSSPTPSGSDSGVCPSLTYVATYTRSATDFTITFTVNTTGVAWVDLHVSLNQNFATDPTTGAYITQYNYRMTEQSNTVFVYSFPGTDGVTIPAQDYVEYFFTYATTFACNGQAGTLGLGDSNSNSGVGTATKASSTTAPFWTSMYSAPAVAQSKDQNSAGHRAADLVVLVAVGAVAMVSTLLF